MELLSYIPTFETVKPYFDDFGVALVFVLGFLVVRYVFSYANTQIKKSKSQPKNFKPASKSNNNSNKQNPLLRYNLYIKENAANPSLDSFDILNRMQKEGVSPDLTTYNSLLDSCFTKCDLQKGMTLFDEMKQTVSPIKPDIISYNVVIKGLTLAMGTPGSNCEELLEQALTVFHEIPSKGLTPNDISYNSLIDACVRSCNMDKAWEVYDSMKVQREADIFTYSTLIKGIKNSENSIKNLDKAFDLLAEIKEKKIIKADEILFNCLLDACIRFKQMNKAVLAFSEMKDMGVMPSSVTYGIMIKGFGQNNMLDKAFDTFMEMKENNLRANDVTYGCLLDACVKNNNIQKALEVFESLKEDEITVNTIIYTTLIKGFTKSKQLDKALDIYNYMKQTSGAKPNIITYNSLIDCCIICGAFDRVQEIFDEMKNNKDAESQPDLITYSTVIKGYCKNRQMDKALEIYNYMKQSNIELDEVLFNSLLDGCAKARDYNNAMMIYEDMKKNNIEGSNVTYSILVKVYSGVGQFDTALQIFDQMQKKGVKPGMIVYTCLIQTSIKNKNIDKAIELFRSMRENNVKADHVVYNTIISGCVYGRRLENACEFLLDSFKDNIKLALDIYNNVLKNLSRNTKDMDKDIRIKYCTTICHEMKQRGVEPDYEIYSKIAKTMYYDEQKMKSTTTNHTSFGNFNQNERSNTNSNERKYNNFRSNNNSNNNRRFNNFNSGFKKSTKSPSPGKGIMNRNLKK